MTGAPSTPRRLALLLLLAGAAACLRPRAYRDPQMDFGTVKTVAILPFANLTKEAVAADRVRDVFANMLLATGAVYVLPAGEVARGTARAGVASPSAPSVEEIVKLGGLLKVDAVLTGVVREYGEVRSGTSASNVISLSVALHEVETGKIVWSAATTKGGITLGDRLLGGGGEPLNDVTELAVDDLLVDLFD